MSNRRYEQGGVVSFVVVATVLALLLAAAIWFAKQQVKSAEQSKNTTTQVANNNPVTNKNDSQSGQGDQPTTKPDETGTSTRSSQPLVANPTTSNSENSNGQAASSTSTTTPNLAQSGPEQPILPVTGLGDVLLTVISVSMLGVGLYLYVGSHKHLRSSALK